MNRLLNFLMLALVLLVLISGGCGGSLLRGGEPSLRLQADRLALRQAARQSLHTAGIVIGADAALPALRISEEQSSSVESLAADGSVSGYTISYTLVYQYADGAEQRIDRRQVVDHDENRYRAGAEQRKQMADSLRRSALAQMIVSLQL